VAVPVIVENRFTGVLTFISEHIRSEDAPVLSVLGAQVSAALERAAHFEQLDTDLNVLQQQIDIRTQELEKVKSQMESIVQSSVDAIIATDLDGYIIFVNNGVETMFGHKKEDIVGQPITRYYAGGKRESRRHRKVIMKKGQMENVELDFLAKGKKIIHTLASLSLLKNRNGSITGVMVMLKDVTEQKRLQQTLESLNKAASHIQKSRTKEEIFTVTGEELKQLDFQVVFMLFNEEKTASRIDYMTPGKEYNALRDQGIILSALEFPVDININEKLVEKKEAVYIDHMKTAFKSILPPYLYNVYRKGIHILGIADKNVILAPLVIHGETIGLLAVISHNITEKNIPSVQAFANQVSTALENARLLKESLTRADELAKNLQEQQLLRELNTELYQAQSLDEVLDATIEGIHKLGKTFSTIRILTEDKKHAAVVRLEVEPPLLKAAKKIGNLLQRATVVGSTIPLQEGSVYHQIFKDQVPLVTSNMDVGEYSVIKADLPDMRATITPEYSGLKRVITRVFQLLQYQSAMVFPLFVDRQTVGSLTVASTHVFSKEDFELMKTRAEMVSSAMERIRHSERVVETSRELKAVQRINTLLNMGASLDSILVQISSNIKDVYHYEFAYPLLLDPSGRFLTFTHVSVAPSVEKKIAREFGVRLKDYLYPIAENTSLFNRVIKEKKFLILEGFEEPTDEQLHDEHTSPSESFITSLPQMLGLDSYENNIMVAPLLRGDETIGVLLLGHRKMLTEEDFQHLKYFLDQVGIAIGKSDTEHRLRQSLKELQELNQMKSEFIDIASHELRTPLTTLGLYLEMMSLEQYGKLSAQLQNRITTMQESVSRLEEIIDQTLVASKLLKNKLDLEEKQVSLQEIAEEVIRQLQPLWKEKNQHVFLEGADLPLVGGDYKALFTVMRSLVDNAIRYSPEHTDIAITFVKHPEEVECVVADQGCGISPEHIEKIFDEFYIVPSETEYARMDGRTGLGLFITKGIVEQHKGRIWVESVPGKGSTFHFTLPRRDQ
jgi:PAS domain S-box-containing protein